MIIKLIVVLVLIFVVGLITVLQTKADLLTDIEKNIALAEATQLTGEEKMSLVVDTVYKAVIPIATMYFTKSRIKKIAQAVFDRMKEYYNAKIAKNEQGDVTVQ